MEKVFIQIGTNDGNDEFNTLVRQNNPSLVILVEPNNSLKEKIIENYKGVNNVILEIVAITTNPGEVELHIPIGDEYGVSENGIKYGNQHFTLIPMDDWGENFRTIKCEGITISNLFEKYNIHKVDYLQIDTEGFDYEIIKSIDFEKVNILNIKYENWPFDENNFKRYGVYGKRYGKNEMYAIEELLKNKGFNVNNIGQDTIANKINMKRKFNVKYITKSRNYILFPNDNAVTRSLFDGHLYEPWLYQFIFDNKINVSGTNIIDIGANNGQITVEFANLVGDNGKVFSFEPQRVIYQQLCGNVFFNGLDNVHAFNVALGNDEGLISVEKPNYHQNGPVNFGDVHVGVEDNYELVQLHKLDSYNFENVSLIKIDVQGYESKVLLGAKETINKNRPIIFIEVEEDQLMRYGETEESVISILSDFGYSTKRFNEGVSFQTVSGKCLDFAAIPNEILDSRDWILKWDILNMSI